MTTNLLYKAFREAEVYNLMDKTIPAGNIQKLFCTFCKQFTNFPDRKRF